MIVSPIHKILGNDFKSCRDMSLGCEPKTNGMKSQLLLKFDIYF